MATTGGSPEKESIDHSFHVGTTWAGEDIDRQATNIRCGTAGKGGKFVRKVNGGMILPDNECHAFCP
jgi:hypothetical protein